MQINLNAGKFVDTAHSIDKLEGRVLRTQGQPEVYRRNHAPLDVPIPRVANKKRGTRSIHKPKYQTPRLSIS